MRRDAGDVRTKRFGLILSAREQEALRRLAEAEGDLSGSAIIRRLIRREARQVERWPSRAEMLILEGKNEG